MACLNAVFMQRCRIKNDFSGLPHKADSINTTVINSRFIKTILLIQIPFPVMTYVVFSKTMKEISGWAARMVAWICWIKKEAYSKPTATAQEKIP